MANKMILQTDVTLKVGESGAGMSIDNVKRIAWEPVPNAAEIRAVTVLNQAAPKGFLAPHKYIRGELHFASEAYTQFHANTGASPAKEYINPDGNNIVIPEVIATAKDEDGSIWTYTFTGFFPIDESVDFDVGEGTTTKELVTIVQFVAKYVTITKPT